MNENLNILLKTPDGIRLKGFDRIKENSQISIRISETSMAIVPEKAFGAKITVKLDGKTSTDAAFVALVQQLCPKDETHFFYLPECNCYFQYP